MSKVYLSGEEARDKVVSGFNKLADSIGRTLGPAGRNAIIGRPFQNPLMTNDGGTISKEFELEDEIEQLGVSVIRDATKRTDDNAGDGTTTTTVLLQAIVKEAIKKLDKKDAFSLNNSNPMAVRKEIDEACAKAEKLLIEKSTKIKTKKDLEHIAIISMENDEVGKIIADLFDKIGKDGVVTVEDNQSFDIEAQVKEGLEIPNGLISPHMVTNQKGEAVIEKPFILMTNESIGSSKQLVPIFNQIKDKTRQLVIFCESIEKEMITEFIIAKLNGSFSFLVIKTPAGKPEVLEDIQAVIGGEIIDTQKGMSLANATIESLGTSDKVISNKDKTLIVGGKGNVKEQIKKLKDELVKTDSQYEKNNLEKRIARLAGGIAVLRVGATTESEREYLKLKVEDAVNATKCALQDGYVKGGGLALKEVADELGDTIITEALRSPYNKIQENAGGNLEIKSTVIDPTKVVLQALKNACSVAGLFITTEIAIADKKEDEKHK